MGLITLQVLDGADRGRIFENISTPVTVGREEGNTIQLNDERVSRFHIKIQEDQGRMVLTDLQSTNGTKVNGEEMELRILRFGDMISVGRSVLRYGSREEITERLASLRKDKPPSHGTDPRITASEPRDPNQDSYDFEANFADDPEIQAALQAFEAPELPDRLSPAQAAQLADLLNFLHIRIRHLIEGVKMERDQEVVSLKQRQWQDLLELQLQLAKYLRAIGDPELRP